MSAMRLIHKTPSRGFTLIELLIVIAIILILIAIALPNFLEAQIRARVTKANSELRTYQIALESYFIDFEVFPWDHDSRWGTPYGPPLENGFTLLTSPIAYLTSLPVDPFGANTLDPSGNAALYYELGSGSDNGPCGGRASYRTGNRIKSRQCIHAGQLIGIGPDAADSTDGNDDFPYRGPTAPIGMTSYAPTNGTSSRGDIYRVVGEWKHGFLNWDGQLIGGPR